MQLKALTAAALILLALPGVSQARDSVLHQDFQAEVDAAIKAGQLDGSVKFYLAGAPVRGKVAKIREVVTNQKTNAFNKSDQEACSWVVRSALIRLQAAAKQSGANAVVDIVSYYKRNEYKDSTTFECHAGAFVAGVALKGQVANVK